MYNYLRTKVCVTLMLLMAISLSSMALTPPTVKPGQRCGYGPVTLGATGAPAGASYKWYRSATATDSLAQTSDTAYVTPALTASPTTFWVLIDSAGIKTTRVPVVATILAAPLDLAIKQLKPRDSYYLSYPFDGSLLDASVLRNNASATPNASLSYVQDRNGRANAALQTNGGTFAGLNTRNNFGSIQALTIDFWMLAKPQAGLVRILTGSNVGSGVGNNRDREVVLNTNGKLTFTTFQTIPANFEANKVVTDSVWHHVIICGEANNRMQMYIDGVKYIDQATANTWQNYGVYWRIGIDSKDGNSRSFVGLLDDFKIYDYAASPQELEGVLSPGPTITQSASQYCGQNAAPVTFSLSQSEGGVVYRLLEQATNLRLDTVIGNGNAVALVAPAPNASTAYRIEATSISNGCVTTLDSVLRVAIGTTPDTLIPFEVTSCEQGPSVLSVRVGIGETAVWYGSALATVPLGVDTIFRTHFLGVLDTARYYVARRTASGCESNRVVIMATSKRAPITTVFVSRFAHTRLKFNQGSLLDIGTAANHGVVSIGTKRDTTDRNGNAKSALYFDGASRLTTTRSISNPQNFTVTIWFKANSTTRSGVQTLLTFNNSQTANGSNVDRTINLLQDGKLAFYVYPGGTIASRNSYDDDNWHHIAARSSAAGTELLVDGQLVARNPGITSAQTYNGFWRLAENAGGQRFVGSLDEFNYFPRVLTDAEVMSQMGDQISVKQGVSSFCFGGGASTVQLDQVQATARYWVLPLGQAPTGAGLTPTGDSLLVPLNITASTQYQITAKDTLTGCVAEFVDTLNFAVAPAVPQPIARDTNVCGSIATTLRAAGSIAGETYRWYLDDVTTQPILNGANPIITATLAATALPIGDSLVRYVAIRTAQGCEGPRKRIVARWYANPTGVVITPSGGQTICTGDSVQLTAPSGFSSYVWSGVPGGGVDSTIWVKTAGTYSVRVRNAAGCQGQSANVVVTVTQRPVTPVIALNGNVLTGTITGGTTGLTYRWYRDGVLTNRTTLTLNLTPADQGVWQLVAVRNTCTSDTSNAVTYTVVGLAEAQDKSILVYPNPTTGKVMMDLTSGVVFSSATVADLTGKLLLSSDLPTLDISALPAGVYHLTIQTNQGRVLRRLIKE
jgi:hypothetical protein